MSLSLCVGVARRGEGPNAEHDTPADEHSVRCCMESICDDDLTGAIDCLAGGMQSVLRPAG